MGTSSIMNIFNSEETRKTPFYSNTKCDVPFNLLELVCSHREAFEEVDRFNSGLGAHLISNTMEELLRVDSRLEKLPKITDEHVAKARELKDYFAPMIMQKKLSGIPITSPWERKLSGILANPYHLREEDVGVLATLPRIWQRYQYLEKISETHSSFPQDLSPTVSSVEGCIAHRDTKTELLTTKHQRSVLFRCIDNGLVSAEIRNFGMNNSLWSLVELMETAPMSVTISGQFHTRELPNGHRYLVARGAAFSWSEK